MGHLCQLQLSVIFPCTDHFTIKDITVFSDPDRTIRNEAVSFDICIALPIEEASLHSGQAPIVFDMALKFGIDINSPHITHPTHS